MSLFESLIVQPIFNVLILIYGLIPGGDFGVSVILFTTLIRFIMWPLVKKQLHQTKVIRKIQPELKKIKVKAKGNKQLEGQLMLELYREKGVNPFGSIGLLLVQLPIFIALYQVIVIITEQRDRIALLTYQPLEQLPAIRTLIDNPDQFNESLLGIVNLAQRAITNEGVYIPAIILALLAAVFQYFQARQTMPQQEDSKRLRDILKNQASGKDVDQSEITAAVSNKMIVLLPFITFGVGLYLPAALVLYLATQSIVAVFQQHIILGQDIDEMESAAAKPEKKSKTSRANQKDTADIVEGEIVDSTSAQSKSETTDDGEVIVQRVSVSSTKSSTPNVSKKKRKRR